MGKRHNHTKKKKNWIRKHPFISSIILLFVLIFIIILTLSSEDTSFSFTYEKTNMSVNGEVYFDGEYFGNTNKGEINVPYFEELPKEMIFKGEYDGIEFEYVYPFPEDYYEYYENNFLVTAVNSNAKLSFYDENYNCSLNGEIYLGNISVGPSKNGEFFLSREDYELYWNGEIGIEGLSDFCFGKDLNLPAVAYWNIEDLEYYFETGESIEFISNLDLRAPVYPKAMQGFIRPEEVEERYSQIRINENKSDLENLETIFRSSYMNYVSDQGKFGKGEYWQTPSNFIATKGGDCEDWAIYMESLLQRYNSEIDCYLAVWYTHANVLCNFNKTFIILDQEKVRKNLVLDENLILQDNQIKTRSWRNNYFETYGIDPDERILFYLIKGDEIIEFENGQEDFIDWVLKKGGILF